jgi:hypothetical protein
MAAATRSPAAPGSGEARAQGQAGRADRDFAAGSRTGTDPSWASDGALRSKEGEGSIPDDEFRAPTPSIS